MIYYLHEKPLLEDIGEVAREIRMPDNIPEVTYVLNKYFTHDVGKGWTLARADEEIQKYKNKLAASSKGGRSAALVNRKSTSGGLLPTNNHKPITNNHKPIKDTLKRPNNVTKKTWEDFLIHRKNLKKPLTETALKGIKKEVSKTSISLEDALVMVQARGWQSFKSDWISKEQKSFATTNYGEGVQKI
tara:strand:+ start:321 stop:884 length:564 start_codon:yes stop_codon:yes gene_type:complete